MQARRVNKPREPAAPKRPRGSAGLPKHACKIASTTGPSIQAQQVYLASSFVHGRTCKASHHVCMYQDHVIMLPSGRLQRHLHEMFQDPCMFMFSWYLPLEALGLQMQWQRRCQSHQAQHHLHTSSTIRCHSNCMHSTWLPNMGCMGRVTCTDHSFSAWPQNLGLVYLKCYLACMHES